MKKISYFVLAMLVGAFCADAGAKSLTSEIRSGLKNQSGHSSARARSAQGRISNYATGPLVYQPLTSEDVGPGEMGREVF